ncbi:MAG: hypothetical protein ACFBZ8_04275 [Opitutales bacterium]
MVNDLLRKGLTAEHQPSNSKKPGPYAKPVDLGRELHDLDNVWELVEKLEGPQYK